MSIAFAETRLEDGFIVYNTRGGPQYLTYIVGTESGFEQRNRVWANARGKWDYGSRKITDTELHAIEGFFRARHGRHQGFRFKDWGNYKTTRTETDEYGVLTQGIVGTVDTPDLILDQLYKKTTSGDDGLGNPFYEYRRIAKPVLTTLRLWLNDSPIAEGVDWEADFSTGLIDFTIEPGTGDVVTAECEFDTPVRFDADVIERTLIAGIPDFSDPIGLSSTYYQLASLPIVEIRVP